MRSTFLRRRTPLLVVALAVTAGFLATVPTATAAPHATTATVAHVAKPAAAPTPPPPDKKQDDVYIRDIVGDTGAEPDLLTPIYESPDIWVCNSAAPCAAPGANPIVGITNSVNVALNNTGPGSVTGDLYVYYTAAGSAALWPGGWTPISVAFGVSVPASGITVTLPWASVPGPGHFCLLARWVSAADPMTFPEGTNTYTNAGNDNNIGWHNVNTFRLGTGGSTSTPFTLNNPTATAVNATLAFTAQGAPFLGDGGGKLTVDLGQTLFARWQQAGEPGVGIAAAGGTQVQVLDPKLAEIEGLAIQPGERFQTTLTFTGGAPVTSDVVVDQTDPKGNDLGGVSYPITVATTQG